MSSIEFIRHALFYQIMCKMTIVHKSNGHAQEATKDAAVKNLANKEENILQLQTELQRVLHVKAQEIQQLEGVIAILRGTDSAQKKKVCPVPKCPSDRFRLRC